MIDKVIAIAKEASALMVTDGFEVSQKDGYENIVTSSDVAVQDFLCKKLAEVLPEAGFFCEENDISDSSHEYTWIIDPIDGTSNYSRGITNCCISIALARSGKVIMGVVYCPPMNELFTAEAGKGAFYNGKPIKVSDKPFEDGIFLTALCTYYKENSEACNRLLMTVFKQCNDFRRFGSAALEICYLAMGRADLYFEFRLSPWDYAAAQLILHEAGGVMTDGDGNPLPLYSKSSVLGANTKANYDRLLSIWNTVR